MLIFAVLFTTNGKTQSISNNPQIKVPAFPGAMGGGMYTTGGRGGKVIKVTNLHDKGSGSFRAAIDTPGARIIIFEISGNIELKSHLSIRHGDLTIAGQTAPGDGICIKGHEVRIYADNIIIRFIRFRPGDIAGKQYDALTGLNNKNIIIDHCSMSWSVDETVSFYDNENFTIQWSIISESLNNSVHSKGPHGYGGIWGGKNASFLCNILAHHNSRNPRLQGTRYNPVDGNETTEIINNIIYNWGEKATYGGEHGNYNIINNIYIPGPATRKSSKEEVLEPYQPYGSFFLEGNAFFLQRSKKQKATWDHVSIQRVYRDSIKSEIKFPFANQSQVLKLNKAYKQVLSKAGASLSRDAVDLRIAREITDRDFTFGSNGIINSQNEVGGWPALRSTLPPIDSDGDGIPDVWEVRHKLNPSDASDGNSFSIDQHYTNLEVYINEIVKKLI